MKIRLPLTQSQTTVIGIIVLAVLLGLSVVFVFRRGNVETIPKPTNNTFTQPQGDLINVNTTQDQFQPVQNFYKDSIVTEQDGTAIIAETTEYQLVYNNEARMFIVALLPFSPPEVRMTAEQAILEKLKVTQQTACTLNVEVHDYSQTSLTDTPTKSRLRMCE